jgi:hypothetical protein
MEGERDHTRWRTPEMKSLRHMLRFRSTLSASVGLVILAPAWSACDDDGLLDADASADEDAELDEEDTEDLDGPKRARDGVARREIPDADAGLGGASNTPPPQAIQSCDVTYLAPGAFLPIDPIPLLAGAASDCTVGTSDSPCAPHHVYVPDPQRVREPLFLFLPGTNMEPDKHDQVLMTAASTGYRTLGLSYDNTLSTADACQNSTACGLDCTGSMREEVVRGVDVSAVVDVQRGDAVLVRLYRLLEELDTIDPTGGWSAYYVATAGPIRSTNIVWENIIVGGFSQGAGVATRISREFQVHGLLVIDGANDTCDDPLLGPVAAEWLTTGSDASAGRPKYGVRHDHGTGSTTNTDVWQAIGLGTSLTSVDCALPFCDVIDSDPPHEASVTAHGYPSPPAAPPICGEHMSMARDECMPTDVTGATPAVLPEDARLFEVYARRMCYACDAATCP